MGAFSDLGDFMRKKIVPIILAITFFVIIILIQSRYPNGDYYRISPTSISREFTDEFDKIYGNSYQWFVENCDERFIALLETVILGDKVIVNETEYIIVYERGLYLFQTDDGTTLSASKIYEYYKLNENDYYLWRLDKQIGKWENITYFN